MADVFISYNHASAEIATALQRGLARLGKKWNRPRALKVFRDKTDLSASPELWTTIVGGLSQARFFILLASPQAAQSHWVGKEVEWWLAHRDPRTFLIALTDGDIAWDGVRDFDWNRTTALPSVLAGRFSNGEPLWVDLRPHNFAAATLQDLNFQDAVATLAAPIRGCSKSQLVGEELRQQRRFTRIRNGVAAGLVVLLVAAVVMGLGFLTQRNTAVAQRDLAISRQLVAESAAQLGTDPRVARLLAVAALRAAPESERDQASATLRAAIMNPGQFVLREPGQLEVAPGVGGGRIATARSDGSIRIWNADTGQPEATLDGHLDDVVALAMNADGTRLVSGSRDGTARVWDLGTGETMHVLPGRGTVWSVAFSPDGALVTTSSGDVWTRDMYAVESGERLWRADGGRRVAFTEDGALLAEGLHDGTVHIRDARSGSVVRMLGKMTDGVDDVQFGEADQRLLVADYNGEVAVFSTADGSETRPRIKVSYRVDSNWGVAVAHARSAFVASSWALPPQVWPLAGDAKPVDLVGHTGPTFAVAFSPDDRTVATAGLDGSIRVWDAETGAQLAVLSGHTNSIQDLTFDESGDRLISQSQDRRVRVWRVARPDRVTLAHDEPGYAPKLNADGTMIVTGSDAVRLFGDDGQLIRTLYQPRGIDVYTGVFSQDGSALAVMEQGELIVLDTTDGRVLQRLPKRGQYPMYPLALSAERGALVTGNTEATTLWNLDAAEVTADFDGADRTKNPAAAISRGGDLMAVTAVGDGVDVVDTRSGDIVRELSGSEGQEMVWEFSSDDRHLVSSEHRSLHVWDLATGERIEMLGHTVEIYDAAFGFGDTVVASASHDKTIRLWDANTGKLLAVLEGGHTEAVQSLAFRDDGTLISTGDDRAIATWDVSLLSGDLVATACGQAGAGFTVKERAEFLGGYGELEAC